MRSKYGRPPHLLVEDIELILDCAADFELLEITNAYTLSAESNRANLVFLRLAETIASWRKKADNLVRKLILDGVHVPFLYLVVLAVCNPYYGGMDDANYGDMNDMYMHMYMYTVILSKDIYLPASGCSEGTWWHAIEEAKMLKQLKSDGIVHA